MPPTEPRADNPRALVEDSRKRHHICTDNHPLNRGSHCTCGAIWPCLTARLADALAAEIEAQKQYLATTLEQQATLVVALKAAGASAANSNKLLVASEQLAERLLGERNQARAEIDALRDTYEPKLPYYGDNPHHFCPAHKVVYSECLDQHEPPTDFVFAPASRPNRTKGSE